MNRYQTAFDKCQAEGRTAFVPFWMLGDPNPEASLEHIRTIAAHADILELGMPFSDPLADGPTIQASVNRSLAAGTNTAKCFEIIGQIRAQFPAKPIGLLVYLNLILAHDINKFFANCEASGVDSVLIPELPIEEVELVKDAAQAYQIDLVFLVSTNTPADRLQKIYQASQGFIYAVSTPSITGAKTEISDDTYEMITRLKNETSLPICVGFGISEPTQVQQLAQAGADGVIIGSKLFEYLKNQTALDQFCNDCAQATKI